MNGIVTSVNVNKQRAKIRGINTGSGAEGVFGPDDMIDPSAFGPSLRGKKVTYSATPDGPTNVRLSS